MNEENIDWLTAGVLAFLGIISAGVGVLTYFMTKPVWWALIIGCGFFTIMFALAVFDTIMYPDVDDEVDTA